jgi:hypothetical protein
MREVLTGYIVLLQYIVKAFWPERKGAALQIVEAINRWWTNRKRRAMFSEISCSTPTATGKTSCSGCMRMICAAMFWLLEIRAALRQISARSELMIA